MAKSTATESESAGPIPTYEITGLVPKKQMPIVFGGRDYDLANLTPDEAEYLLGFPEQVPYLKKSPAPESKT